MNWRKSNQKTINVRKRVYGQYFFSVEKTTEKLCKINKLKIEQATKTPKKVNIYTTKMT